MHLKNIISLSKMYEPVYKVISQASNMLLVRNIALAYSPGSSPGHYHLSHH